MEIVRECICVSTTEIVSCTEALHVLLSAFLIVVLRSGRSICHVRGNRRCC
jgi:hypothetical protein